MKEKEILSLTAVQLGKKIKEREVTCREALEAVFAQIRRREPELNCYVTLEEEKAFKQADEVQRGIDEGTLTGPLAVCQAVRQAVPAPRLRQMNAFMRLVPIRAGPYGSPAHSAG